MIEINDIIIEKVNFKGKDYVSIRKWYESDGEKKPGKNGINMPLNEWNIFIEKFEEIKKDISNS